jgi:hypothetical protein
MSDSFPSSKQFKTSAVNVDPALHRAIKLAAADRGMMMNALVDQAFRRWLVVYADETLYSLLPEQYRHREKLQLQARSTNALDC